MLKKIKAVKVLLKKRFAFFSWYNSTLFVCLGSEMI